jgi:hypothetical protein
MRSEKRWTGASFVAGLALAVVAVSGGFAPAEDCTCAPVGPPCQAFWSADAVFDATVLTIEKNEQHTYISISGEPVPAFGGNLAVTLEIHRPWKGITGKHVQVLTYDDAGACGFRFETGERYLVFASRSRADSRWLVTSCGATTRYVGMGETAAFLASLEQPATGGRIFGSVRLPAPWLDGSSGGDRPLDVPVRLLGPGGSSTTTARGGRYEFAGLPPGHYEVQSVPPPGHRAGWARAEIVNAHACAQADLRITPSGTLSGRIVDASGHGVRAVTLQITGERFLDPTVSYFPTVYARTDDLGNFAFEGLTAGRYVLGVNLGGIPGRSNPYPSMVYPGAQEPPHVFELALGESRDIGQWELPSPPALVSIAAVVTWADGTAAADVVVAMSDITGNQAPRAVGWETTGPDGRVTIEGREGRIYAFTVRTKAARAMLPIVAAHVEARPNLEPVRIVIQQAPPR